MFFNLDLNSKLYKYISLFILLDSKIFQTNLFLAARKIDILFNGPQYLDCKFLNSHLKYFYSKGQKY